MTKTAQDRRPPAYPAPEFPPLRQLELEEEALGYLVSAHPLALWQAQGGRCGGAASNRHVGAACELPSVSMCALVREPVRR
jgi:hypothetical protein